MATFRQQQAQKIVEKITADGWTFKVQTYTPIMKGWWVAPDAKDYKYRGDPKEFYYGAQIVAELYVEIK